MVTCVPDTKKDVFSTVKGKLDSNLSRVGHTEENGDYTRNPYMASFKLSSREFRSGLNAVHSTEIVNLDMRHLHYQSWVMGGMRQLQNF